jgi:ABC-type bacteriocin/lantibiotic exporter with double-glycine peptidase domain
VSLLFVVHFDHLKTSTTTEKNTSSNNNHNHNINGYAPLSQSFDRSIELSHVCVKYDGKVDFALDDVSVRVAPGCTALLGENG